jgi:hypothetical protein
MQTCLVDLQISSLTSLLRHSCLSACCYPHCRDLNPLCFQTVCAGPPLTMTRRAAKMLDLTPSCMRTTVSILRAALTKQTKRAREESHQNCTMSGETQVSEPTPAAQAQVVEDTAIGPIVQAHMACHRDGLLSELASGSSGHLDRGQGTVNAQSDLSAGAENVAQRASWRSKKRSRKANVRAG